MSSISSRSRSVFAVLALVALTACGDDGFQVIEEIEFASTLNIELASMTRTASGLYIQEIDPGQGDPVAAGQRVEVGYIGWLANGQSFDDGAFAFTLGRGEVVPGFDEGVTGMRLGGIRKIVIPPSLGYGDRGAGSIPPGAVIVFQVELREIL